MKIVDKFEYTYLYRWSLTAPSERLRPIKAAPQNTGCGCGARVRLPRQLAVGAEFRRFQLQLMEDPNEKFPINLHSTFPIEIRIYLFNFKN